MLAQVGAGPTGLLAALSLVQNGAKIRVIEKSDRFVVGQRGAGIAVSFSRLVPLRSFDLDLERWERRVR